MFRWIGQLWQQTGAVGRNVPLEASRRRQPRYESLLSHSMTRTGNVRAVCSTSFISKMLRTMQTWRDRQRERDTLPAQRKPLCQTIRKSKNRNGNKLKQKKVKNPRLPQTRRRGGRERERERLDTRWLYYQNCNTGAWWAASAAGRRALRTRRTRWRGTCAVCGYLASASASPPGLRHPQPPPRRPRQAPAPDPPSTTNTHTHRPPPHHTLRSLC